MKNSNVCIKCNSKEVVKIPRKVDMTLGGGNIIKTSQMFYLAKVNRYLCTTCGYSEEWVESKGDLKRLKKDYS